MALQSSDYFLVNRAGTSYKVDWNELQTAQEGSLRIEDVWDYTTDGNGITIKANSQVPLDIDQGIRLPVAGTGDYNEDGAIRYSPDNSKIELYYDGAWNTASGGTAFSTTPPIPATIGDVWFDTDNGRAYVYYDDGTSQQWVEMNPAWDGGVPPSVIDSNSLEDGSITPQKLSNGKPVWNTGGYVGVNQPADANDGQLAVRSTNSDNTEVAFKATQGTSTGANLQTFEVKQNAGSRTTTLEVDNAGAGAATLVLSVDGNDRLTIPASGNISTPATISAGGFTGDVTGDVSGSSGSIRRTGISSSSTDNFRVLLGEANNNSGESNAYVVSNSARMYYRPSDDRLVVGTVNGNLSGTATNANQLAGVNASSYARQDSANNFTGSVTFNSTTTFSGTNFFTSSTRYNDNVRLNMGSGNDASMVWDGSNALVDLKAGALYVRDTSSGASIKHTFNRNGTYVATGSVTAPTFNGNLSGNASSATNSTNSTNVSIAATATNSTHYLMFANGTSGNRRANVDGSITYNPSSNTLSTTNLNLSGTLSAGTISGSLNGNASSATNATNVNVLATSTNASYYLLFAGGTSGNQRARSDAGISYNPATNTLNASNISVSGTLSGNISATNATNASKVSIATSTSSADQYITFTDGTSGNRTVKVDSGSSLRYNPSSNTLKVANLAVAGTLTGTFNAATANNATNSTNINVTTGGNTSYAVVFATNSTGNQRPRIDGGLLYNPSSNTLFATNVNVSGTLSGNVTARYNDNQRLYLGTNNQSSFRNDGTNLILDMSKGTFFIRDTSSGASIEHSFRRDGSYTAAGTVTAPSFSGNLTGNVTGTATNATNINVAATSNNANHYVLFSNGTSGNRRPLLDSALSYNPSSNTLTVPNFSVTGSLTAASFTGDLNGNATSAYRAEYALEATTALRSDEVIVSNDSGSNDRFVTFVNGSGERDIRIDSNLKYNSNSNTLIVDKIVVNTSITGAGAPAPGNTVTISTISNSSGRQYLAMAGGTSGTRPIGADGGLYWDPDSNQLTAQNGSFSGRLAGRANIADQCDSALGVNLTTYSGSTAKGVWFGSGGTQAKANVHSSYFKYTASTKTLRVNNIEVKVGDSWVNVGSALASLGI